MDEIEEIDTQECHKDDEDEPANQTASLFAHFKLLLSFLGNAEVNRSAVTVVAFGLLLLDRVHLSVDHRLVVPVTLRNYRRIHVKDAAQFALAHAQVVAVAHLRHILAFLPQIFIYVCLFRQIGEG